VRTVTDAQRVIEIVRRRCCAYIGNHCDCKFGIEKAAGRVFGEAGNGCPELRDVAELLSLLTPYERQRLAKRLAKVRA